MSKCVGVEVDMLTNGSVFVHQRHYILDILKNNGMESCPPRDTPMGSKIRLTANQSPQNDSEQVQVVSRHQSINYRQAVGQLLFLLNTRPDLAYAVGEVSRFVANPGHEHFLALKRIFQYLKGTIDFGILYDKSQPPTLKAYSDSDWAGDPDTSKSTTGYVFTFMGEPITYRSSRQKSIALSACDAETIAVSSAAQEAVWLRLVLEALGFAEVGPTTIYQDSQSSIAFAHNETQHTKMKHLKLRDRYVRDLIEQKLVDTKYVPSAENLADIFTKPLPKPAFLNIRSKLNIVDGRSVQGENCTGNL